ncbi:MAG: YerC/YecD family TrpR-related protein [Alphaproteobacteria bacterium]
MIDLYDSFLKLKTSNECKNFLKDLCTPREIRDFQDRWKIAQMLKFGDKSYRQIAKETGASVTTIGRVARFLKDEPYQGYNLVISRIKNKK